MADPRTRCSRPKGGLLVCASTGTGVDIGWLTTGDPDDSPTVYAEDPPWLRFDGTITALLVGLLTGTVRGDHLGHLFDHLGEAPMFASY